MSQHYALFIQEGDLQFSLSEKPRLKMAIPAEQLSSRPLPEKLANKLQDKLQRQSTSKKNRYFAHLAGEPGDMPSLKRIEQDQALRSSLQSKTLSRKGGQ